MLSTFAEIERGLARYNDAFQPRTASFVSVGGSGRGPGGEVFHPTLLEDLELRAELRARLSWLDHEERLVLLRWYIESRPVQVIARELGRSVRHVYRVRNRAMERILELGRDDEFADASVAEFA